MTAPNALLGSHDERNNEPAVNKQHQNPEHSQEHALQRVRFRPAEQAKRADSSREANAAT
jgi:hypothetical protein